MLNLAQRASARFLLCAAPLGAMLLATAFVARAEPEPVTFRYLGPSVTTYDIPGSLGAYATKAVPALTASPPMVLPDGAALAALLDGVGPAVAVVADATQLPAPSAKWRVLAVAQVEGRRSTRTLMIGKPGVTPDKVKRLAVPNVGADYLAHLDRALFAQSNQSHGAFQTVKVSKYLDGLLALRAGQVEAALLDERDWDRLKTKQPALTKGVEIIASGKEIPIGAVVATSAVMADVADATVDAFKKMSDAPKGKELLKAWGFDAWLKPDKPIELPAAIPIAAVEKAAAEKAVAGAAEKAAPAAAPAAAAKSAPVEKPGDKPAVPAAAEKGAAKAVEKPGDKPFGDKKPGGK